MLKINWSFCPIYIIFLQKNVFLHFKKRLILQITYGFAHFKRLSAQMLGEVFFFLPKFLLDPFLEIEIGIGRGVKLYHDTISNIEIIILVQMGFI